MRVLKLGLLSSIAIVAFGAAFSTEVRAQDTRMIGGGSGITVFEDRDFRGDATTYNSNQSNLNSRFNNKISSIRVGGGETWQICDQANYRGQCVNVSGEERDLRQNNWDNKISSLRRISGGGGGWPGNPGGGSRPPRWAVGTWYWTNGSNRTMVINSSGNVSVNNQGQYSHGTYRNGRITLDGIVSTITRTNSGIRTNNLSSGEISDYSRNSWGGGGGGGWGSAPSWAVGRWRWVQGSNRSMTITADGRVTVVNQGRTTYGNFNGSNSFTLDGITSTVSQNGRRLRTVNRSSGEVSDYRRQ
jgi:hypothetical protein